MTILFTSYSRPFLAAPNVPNSTRVKRRQESLFMRWQRAARFFFSAPQVRLFRLFQRSAFEKVRRRRTTNRVCARTRNHAANHVAPPREKLQHRARTLAKEHAQTDVCSECSNKLGRSPQASFSAADVHDSGNHQHL